MKLFLFIALFAVSASALTSVNSVSEECLSEDLQALMDDMMDYITFKGQSTAAEYLTAFTEFFEPKLEQFEAVFRAKLRKAITTKWTTLASLITDVPQFITCFKSLIPSLVEQAVKFARDSNMGMEQMVEDIEEYLLGLNKQADYTSWLAEFDDTETGFKAEFILMNETFRDKVYDNLFAKATTMTSLYASDPAEFHKILLLYVRGAVEKAVKDAAVFDKDSLKTAFRTRLETINAAGKYSEANMEAYGAKILSVVEELTCDFLPALRSLTYEEFAERVNCWVLLCDVPVVEKHLWFMAQHIVDEIETEWNKIKDDVTIEPSQGSCVTPSAAPAPASTPCVSPNSWSNRRPATNWWNC